MPPDQIALPRYKCHKEVNAAKIIDILWLGDNQGKLVLESEDGAEIIVPGTWLQKHNPKIGGYFVRYRDDYDSYSPAAAFEEGYTLIP